MTIHAAGLADLTARESRDVGGGSALYVLAYNAGYVAGVYTSAAIAVYLVLRD